MISEREIKDLCARIVASFKPERVILFGSHASGEASPESDVDLLVIMPFEGSGIRMSAEIVQTVRPRIPVDLIVRRPDDVKQRIAQRDFFLAGILKQGRVMYESSRQ